MIGIPNYRMFSGFLLVILPLLWLGACAFTWVFLSIPPQPEVMGESMRAVFSLFAPFLSVGILAVLLEMKQKQAYCPERQMRPPPVRKAMQA